MWTVFQVGLGGALGAMARFGLGLWALRLVGQGFPVGVLGVNILGSFLMGLCVVWLGQRGMGHLSPFLMTGILGGFTTFSAFSLEAFALFERAGLGQASLYVGLSVVGALSALIAGVLLMRWVLV